MKSITNLFKPYIKVLTLCVTVIQMIHLVIFMGNNTAPPLKWPKGDISLDPDIVLLMYPTLAFSILQKILNLVRNRARV